MKRKMWIVMALAAMILALWCGSAMAATIQRSGTVNVSSLPDHASLILTGDTTLIVDADKTLESIMGENYVLAIHGNNNLSLYADKTAINVKTIESDLSGLLFVEFNVETWNDRPAIQAEGNINITGPVEIYAEDYGSGIRSENGDISLSGNIKINYNSNYSIFAHNGSIYLSGDCEVWHPIMAKYNVVQSGGSLKIKKRGGITSYNGNIDLDGEVIITSSSTHQGFLTDPPIPIRARAGNVYLKGQITINCDAGDHDDPYMFPCIYAQNDITQINGSLYLTGQCGMIAGENISLAGSTIIQTIAISNDSGSCAPSIGMRSLNGNITLSGISKVFGNNAIEAPNGSVTLHGNLEVGVVSTSGEYAINAKYGIQSDCASIVKNGPFYGLNGYYYVTQFLPTSGTGTMPPKMSWQGAEITLPGCLFDAPENCRFKCWSNAAHPSLNAGDTVVINGDTNFYAKWERIPRTVTFSPGSGSGTMASLTVGQGEQLTLPACTFNPPSLPGTTYSFDRWKIGTSLYNPGSKVTITGNTTVTATWKSDTVLVEFLPNGGTGKMASPILSKGDTYTLPENGFTPPAGKAFLYWNVSSYGKYLGPGAVITVMNDITVKPMWRNAVISFDPNGGTGTIAPVTMSDSMNGIYTFPACSFTPPANKTFYSWLIVNVSRQPGESLPIYGDRVAKALWVDRMYTVSFIHGSDSSGTMSPVQVTSGSVYTFPACTFTPPSGKVFRGWLLSGKVYHQGETVTVTGNMQLYAEWQENPNNVYTLTFDGNGLAGSMPSISVKSGETITMPECMFEVSEAMYFQKWNLGADFGFYKNPGDTITLNQNATAKAVWGYKSQCTVTFKTNGLYKGELPASQTGYGGFCATEPEPLQMDGRIFLGWFTNLTTNEEFRWDFSTPVTSDLNLYCGWASAPPVAHPISITTNGHGTAIAYDAYEGGNEISEATQNTWVYVTVTPDPGYEQQYGGLDWTTASGQSGHASLNRFTMPDEAVAVSVLFRPVRVNFILPASLTSIEDEAFSGIAATAVVIPGSVTSITGNPFAGIDTLTIYGYPGSAAETFANRIPGYTFIPIDDEWMEGQ